MEQGKEWFKFFKFYLDWYEVLKELPDKDRLATFDVLFQSAKDVIEGREPTTDNGKISPLLKGWLNVALTTIKEDVHKAKNIRQRNSEGGKTAMRKRWNKQPEDPEEYNEEYNEEIAEKEYALLRSVFCNKPHMIKAYCENQGLTCINAYFAICSVFIRNYLASGKPPHKNINGLYEHFSSWYITICKDARTKRTILDNAQTEFDQWNRDFPQGNEKIKNCDIEMLVTEYERYCKN